MACLVLVQSYMGQDKYCLFNKSRTIPLLPAVATKLCPRRFYSVPGEEEGLSSTEVNRTKLFVQSRTIDINVNPLHPPNLGGILF